MKLKRAAALAMSAVMAMGMTSGMTVSAAEDDIYEIVIQYPTSYFTFTTLLIIILRSVFSLLRLYFQTSPGPVQGDMYINTGNAGFLQHPRYLYMPEHFSNRLRQCTPFILDHISSCTCSFLYCEGVHP